MVTRRVGRWPALVVFVCGLAIAGIAGASLGSAAFGDARDAPVAFSLAPAPAPAPDVGPLDAARSSVPPRPEVPDSSSRTPARLELLGLGVAVPVVPVGVDPAGSLEVPSGPEVVGWWRSGAGPGQAGSTLIAGHVDTATGGLGVFARLTHLKPGAPVLVETAAGERLRYRVAERRQFPKVELPTHLGSARDGPERLVLVTCGGRFDRDAGGYSDNVVVFAVPDGRPPARAARDAG